MAITSNATAIVFNDATVQTTAFTGGGDIPAGTVMLFYQNAAPTGWTIVTSQNNKALRVVSSAGGVAGGTTSFSSVFTNQTVTTSISVSGTTGATTLSTSQIPSHNHSTFVSGGSFPGLDRLDAPTGFGDFSTIGTSSTGGGGSHTHSFSGSGSGTSSVVTLNVQYIDIILCSKN
jgi:hypothetical protein